MKTQRLSSLAGLIGATALSAGLLCQPARAEGLYVGGDLGAPHFGSNGVNGIDGNGKGVAGGVFGGYQFSPYGALEVGLSDFGRVSGDNGSLHSHGEYLDAVGLLPLGDSFSLLGSLGVAHVALDTTNGDDSGDGLKLGLGAQYTLTDHIALRAEWTRVRPSAFGTRTDVDQYLFGVRYGF